MATIHREFIVDAPPQFVWDAIRDVGAVHSRLAHGFVTATVLDGNERLVTFANGFTVRERIVAISNELHRLAYSAVGGRASHHNACFQVYPETQNRSRVVWATDLLPDDAREPVEQMVEHGVAAIRRTLENSYLASR